MENDILHNLFSSLTQYFPRKHPPQMGKWGDGKEVERETDFI